MGVKLYDRREKEELRIGRAAMFKVLHQIKKQPDHDLLFSIGGLVLATLIPAFTAESFISIAGMNGSTIRGVLITAAIFSLIWLAVKLIQWRHSKWETIESTIDTLFSKRKI